MPHTGAGGRGSQRSDGPRTQPQSGDSSLPRIEYRGSLGPPSYQPTPPPPPWVRSFPSRSSRNTDRQSFPVSGASVPPPPSPVPIPEPTPPVSSHPSSTGREGGLRPSPPPVQGRAPRTPLLHLGRDPRRQVSPVGTHTEGTPLCAEQERPFVDLPSGPTPRPVPLSRTGRTPTPGCDFSSVPGQNPLGTGLPVRTRAQTPRTTHSPYTKVETPPERDSPLGLQTVPRVTLLLCQSKSPLRTKLPSIEWNPSGNYTSLRRSGERCPTPPSRT